MSHWPRRPSRSGVSIWLSAGTRPCWSAWAGGIWIFASYSLVTWELLRLLHRLSSCKLKTLRLWSPLVSLSAPQASLETALVWIRSKGDSNMKESPLDSLFWSQDSCLRFSPFSVMVWQEFLQKKIKLWRQPRLVCGLYFCTSYFLLWREYKMVWLGHLELKRRIPTSPSVFHTV